MSSPSPGCPHPYTHLVVNWCHWSLESLTLWKTYWKTCWKILWYWEEWVRWKLPLSSYCLPLVVSSFPIPVLCMLAHARRPHASMTHFNHLAWMSWDLPPDPLNTPILSVPSHAPLTSSSNLLNFVPVVHFQSWCAGKLSDSLPFMMSLSSSAQIKSVVLWRAQEAKMEDLWDSTNVTRLPVQQLEFRKASSLLSFQ